MEKVDNTPYDDVFRTMVNDLPHIVIKLINEMFSIYLTEKYVGDEQVETPHNEMFINQQDGKQDKIVTDARITIVGHDEIRRQYHIECQSTPDGSMMLRVFEYDSQIALQDSNTDNINQHLTVNYPNSGILFLRSTDSTPDELTITINTPGGCISYKIPAVKMKNYTVDDVIRKDLYFLIPFYLFKFDELIKSEAEQKQIDDNNIQILRQDYQRIRAYLDESCAKGKISEYEKSTILDMSNKVLNNLSVKAEKIKEEVKSIMGGKVLEYEAKSILNQGRTEGRAEEKSTGIKQLSEYFMSQDPTLSKEDAEAKAKSILK